MTWAYRSARGTARHAPHLVASLCASPWRLPLGKCWNVSWHPGCGRPSHVWPLGGAGFGACPPDEGAGRSKSLMPAARCLAPPKVSLATSRLCLYGRYGGFGGVGVLTFDVLTAQGCQLLTSTGRE